MRTQKKNKQKFYYALKTGTVDIVDSDGNKTGEKRNTYSTPVEAWANVSASKGSIGTYLFGLTEQYSKTIVYENDTLPIDRESVLWVDDLDTTASADYLVAQIARSLNSTTLAIKKVR